MSMVPSYTCTRRTKTNLDFLWTEQLKNKTPSKQTTKACNVICKNSNAERILKFIHSQGPDVLNFSLNKKRIVIIIQEMFFLLN